LNGLIASLRSGFGGLLRFSGRESPALFWPYVGVLFAAAMMTAGAVMVPIMATAFARMQAFAAEHPEQATVRSGPGHYSITIEDAPPGLMPDVSPFVEAMSVMIVAMVLLLAAAVTRRLHDRGRAGFWGLMPIPFLVIGLYGAQRLLADFENLDFRLFGLLFANNLLYLASLGLLVALLLGQSDPNPNRYGPPPPR
jgi:uncharacterized membrane protein YhaH (DUF805 family)